MSDIKPLNLFFGQEPNESFLKDLKVLNKLKENEIIKIINFVIEEYPRGIDKAWEEWSKDFKEEKKKEIEGFVEGFLFIFKAYVVGHISESELRSDTKELGILDAIVDYFVNKLRSADDFRKQALVQEQPFRSTLKSVDWRIDRQNYGQDFGTNVCAIEFAYRSKGKLKAAQFDLSLEGIRYLISILNKIEKNLCHLNKNKK